MGFRVAEDEEITGVDRTAHAETAYDFTGAGGGAVHRVPAVALGTPGALGGGPAPTNEAERGLGPDTERVDA